MPDRLALPVLALLATGLITLALVWPQGQGAPSPAPFGHSLAPLPTPVATSGANAKSVAAMEAAPKSEGRARATPDGLRGPEPAAAHP